MNKSNVPRFSELLDWLEGRLPPDEARDVAERLHAADAATQADLDWLRLFLQASRSVRFASPPPGVRETLKQRFAAFAEARQLPGLFQRWLATLTFDSHAQPVTAGLRSAAEEGQRRQLIYTTEGAEIALNLHSIRPDENFVVTGQIFPTAGTPPHAFSIQLLRGAGEVALAAADELGEFTFADIPAGEYDMVLSAGGYEVVISSLLLRP
ncbi:MAG TPA: carboxypeptidase-like regulatory domain-containing protein [Anaerolineales bacterium]|nr:carboxypeptidase-like regulatory domain-containing protein [Anaerolineales bacterium]